MVLRELFTRFSFINMDALYFVMGAAYSALGIMLAAAIFPEHTGIVAVFFISIALMPSIDRLFDLNEILAGRQTLVKNNETSLIELKVNSSRFSLRNFVEDHHELFRAYTFSFLGIFFAFAAITLAVQNETAFMAFGEQAKFYSAGYYPAQGDMGFLTDVISNNLGVLFVSFILALLFEYGFTFVVAWNASVWSVVFALRAKGIEVVAGQSQEVQFLFLMLAVIPHIVLEAGTYVLAAMSGGLVSRALREENIFVSGLTQRFSQIMARSAYILLAAIAMLAAAGIVETFVPGIILGLF